MSEQHKSRAFWVYATLAVLLIVWIGVKTQMTADRQEREAQNTLVFADQTRECLHQLLDALTARAQITENSDRLNNDQHKALADLITAITAARGEAAYGQVLADFLPSVIEAQQRQEALLTARSEHPLPNPSCPAVSR